MATSGTSDSETPRSGPFRALRHRDFRLYVIGQTTSLAGSWVQTIALSWLVYNKTKSTWLMGVVQFCTLFPIMPFGPLAGYVSDRFAKRWVIIWMQALMLAQALALAVLVYTDSITTTQVIVLSLSLGLFTAFETPARQSIYVHMVGREDLPNAIALNSMAFNVARVIGPSIGGMMIYAIGEVACFLLNAASYVAVIVSYWMMTHREPEREPHASALGHFTEGLRYAWTHRPLRALLGLSTATNIASAPILVLAPVFADGIFHMGSPGYGWLTGAFGLGAIGATFRLARNQQVGRTPGIVAFAAVAVGASVILFSMAPAYAICLAAMLLCGFSVMTQLPGTNMLVQMLVEEEYRGRVMALYSMTVIGMIPIGNLLAGAVAEAVGVRWTAFLGGVGCLIGAALFSRARVSVEHSLAGRTLR